tara:strand:+ start:513 stop:1724 length:1212 start_codon:yes stop_codon:yes gene_type:complete
MCVIASIPAGQTITEEELRDMWQTNPDGGGIAFIKDGAIKVKKTLKLKTFLKWFKEIVKEHGSNDILVHMRVKTHGDVCKQNVHPFNVIQDGKPLKDMVFAHNGILPSAFLTTEKDRDTDGIQISDTRRFNELFWGNFDIRALDDPRVIDVIEELIGWGNKLVVLNANPALKHQTYVINSGRGVYKDACWFSNQNHIKPVYSNIRDDNWGRKTFDGANESISRDSEVLSAIAQGDPDANGRFNTSNWAEMSDDELDAIGLMDGLYDENLIDDDDFLKKIEALLEVTRYNNLKDALEGMYFEIDIDGKFRCPDCQNELDQTNNFERTCHETCMFENWDGSTAEEYYEELEESERIAAERQDWKQNDTTPWEERADIEQAVDKHVRKAVNHTVYPDITGQTSLFD